MATTETNNGLGDLVALYKQLSAISAVVFAPLARTYVGTLEQRDDRSRDAGSADVVNLALRKLAFEAGELLVANHPPTEKPLREFSRNADGQLPDLSLAYVAAAALAYVKSRDQKVAAPIEDGAATNVRALRASARTTAYTGALAPPLGTRATTVRATGGCGCGGRAAAPPTGGCGCAACQAQPVTTTECPPVVTISCETRQRLRDCIKQLVCDLIEYIETKLCANAQAGTPLAILCNFLHCVRDAICPETAPTPLPCGPAMPCLPCGYAVEIP